MPAPPGTSENPNHSRQSTDAWPHHLALAAGVLLVLFSAMWIAHTQLYLFAPSYETAAGETKSIHFNEGSVAHLNTRTEVRWLGTAEQRRVRLVSGEALFDVARDETRPFSVALDGSEIRVLGTRFNVYRKASGDVAVTVLEGVVEVRGSHPSLPAVDHTNTGDSARTDSPGDDPPHDGTPGDNPQANEASNTTPSSWMRRVSANQQLEYNDGGLIREPHPTDAESVVKWRQGAIALPDEGMALAGFLAELNRYTNKRILLTDAQLAGIRVGGTYSTRDVRNTLARLERIAPIHVTETRHAFMVGERQAHRSPMEQ